MQEIKPAGVSDFGGFDHDLKLKTWIFRTKDGRTCSKSAVRWGDAREAAAIALKVSAQDLESGGDTRNPKVEVDPMLVLGEVTLGRRFSGRVQVRLSPGPHALRDVEEWIAACVHARANPGETLDVVLLG